MAGGLGALGGDFGVWLKKLPPLPKLEDVEVLVLLKGGDVSAANGDGFCVWACWGVAEKVSPLNASLSLPEAEDDCET